MSMMHLERYPLALSRFCVRNITRCRGTTGKIQTFTSSTRAPADAVLAVSKILRLPPAFSSGRHLTAVAFKDYGHCLAFKLNNLERFGAQSTRCRSSSESRSGSMFQRTSKLRREPSNKRFFFPSVLTSSCASYLQRRTFKTQRHIFSEKQPESEGKSAYADDSDKKIRSLIETWFYEVSPYGEVVINLPFHTVIKPLNVNEYVDMNKVIISMNFDSRKSSEQPSSHQLSSMADLYNLNVEFEKDRANMRISCSVAAGVELPVICTLQVPLKCVLTARTTGDRSLSVEGLESESINMESERGECIMHRLKSGMVSVMSQAGNISSRSAILGNALLHTGMSGNIQAEKIQGSDIQCKTQMGSISIKSLYADSATFSSDAGNIHLGHCHGQLYVQSDKTDLQIDSLDGDLDVCLQSGCVDVHLSKHRKVDIDVNTGDIALSFPEGANTDLNVNSPAVTVDEKLNIEFQDSALPHQKEGFLGQPGKAQLNARTLSGSISLKQLDWIQTTKLANLWKSDS